MSVVKRLIGLPQTLAIAAIFLFAGAAEAKKRRIPTGYNGKAFATAEVPGVWVVDYNAQGGFATATKVRTAALCASLTLATEEGYDRIELLEHLEGTREWNSPIRGIGARNFSVRIRGFKPEQSTQAEAYSLGELAELWECKTPAEPRSAYPRGRKKKP